jgi:hypothetical protein
MVADLVELGTVIASMNGAMPTLAAELRRECRERIEDLIHRVRGRGARPKGRD